MLKKTHAENLGNLNDLKIELIFILKHKAPENERGAVVLIICFEAKIHITFLEIMIQIKKTFRKKEKETDKSIAGDYETVIGKKIYPRGYRFSTSATGLIVFPAETPGEICNRISKIPRKTWRKVYQ